jgi:hypothetical protein
VAGAVTEPSSTGRNRPGAWVGGGLDLPGGECRLREASLRAAGNANSGQQKPMGESNRAAFLLVVGAVLSKMDRKNLVVDDDMRALLSRMTQKERLPPDRMDELLSMAIRKNHLSRDDVVEAIEIAIRELPERRRVAQAEVLRNLRQRVMKYRKSAGRRS